MPYSKDHKQETRTRILEAAVRELKARGVGGAGVQSVMRAAGLTHGGFYAHFASKDALVGEALLAAFEASRRMWAERLAGRSGRAWLEAWIDVYLSPQHLERVTEGCPCPPLAAEISRGDERLRATFSSIVDDWATGLAQHMPAGSSARAEAFALVSQAVGAMTLARAVERPLAEEILGAARASALRSLERIHPSAGDETSRA